MLVLVLVLVIVLVIDPLDSLTRGFLVSNLDALFFAVFDNVETILTRNMLR